MLLAGAMAVNSATLQLVAAVSALTFVLVMYLDEVGVDALALGASVVALAPILFILMTERAPGRAVPEAT